MFSQVVSTAGESVYSWYNIDLCFDEGVTKPEKSQSVIYNLQAVNNKFQWLLCVTEGIHISHTKCYCIEVHQTIELV